LSSSRDKKIIQLLHFITVLTLLFGCLVIALLGIGWYRRRQEDRAWYQQERHEESGEWIDKRPGERGTYGSLDREREAERAAVFQAGRTRALAESMCRFLQMSATPLPAAVLQKAGRMMQLAETLATAKMIALPPNVSILEEEQVHALKKHVLDILYDYYPSILDADVQQIQYLDRHITHILYTKTEN
jgi:hypothetical protein